MYGINILIGAVGIVGAIIAIFFQKAAILVAGFATGGYIAMGLAAGALGGLLGMAALEFSCNNDQALHLMVWHTGVLAASAAFGALAGYAADRYRRHAV